MSLFWLLVREACPGEEYFFFRYSFLGGAPSVGTGDPLLFIFWAATPFECAGSLKAPFKKKKKSVTFSYHYMDVLNLMLLDDMTR